MLTELTDRAFWQRMAADADAAPLIAQVRAQHDDNAEKAASILRFGQRYRHYRDGTRASFEQPYFARRRFLTAAVLLALLYPDDPAYRDEAQDTIMAICEETCWSLPAHTSGVPEEDAVCIDLFAAETGMMLAEIRYALGDRLDAIVRDRIAAEVGRRIRDNYRAHTYFWESCHHNWAAVCASNVGGALLYTDPQAFETALPRLKRTFACFLDGFPDDGVCLEGMRYWQFGFGEYVWFADLLYRDTAGKTDLLATEKVRRIAAYGQNMLLCGGAAVSFSDSPPNSRADLALQRYLHRRFPETVARLPEEYLAVWIGNCSWLQLSRTLLYGRADSGEMCAPFVPRDVDYPDGGQVVVHRPGYALAAKAGHNDEPHNHNDIGSFIVATARGQVLCDPGPAPYVAQYFDPRRRYSFLHASSLGHSVPLINGQEQTAGRDRTGQLWREGHAICLEMAGAYAVPSLRALTRRIVPEERRLWLHDRFAGEGLTIVERFVTPFEPQLAPGEIVLPGVRLRFALPDTAVCIHAESEESGDGHPLYCIDFSLPTSLSADRQEFSLEIVCGD